MSFAVFGQRQSHRKVATQSHRSTERELYDSGTAGIELDVKKLVGPLRDAVAQQVVERVKTFAFGAKDVPPVTIVYPIDFLPAA